MGRRPTKNNNLPPHMRKRVKPSGKTWYYLDTGAKPRKEIPLGDDYILALKKYADLNVVCADVAEPTFGDAIKRYETYELPKLAANTIRVQKSDIKHLKTNFEKAPFEEMRPLHIHKLLNKMQDKKTTANRCKRLVSTIWNHARSWGYTDLPNPCIGIKGFKLAKRTIYIKDAVFKAVYECGSDPLKDAMDLAYLIGQRPDDALKKTEHDIEEGHMVVEQGKTKQPLRIAITGELLVLLTRIRARKSGYKIVHTNLLLNTQGKPLTKAVLRKHFVAARAKAAVDHPDLADQIKSFWFYDLRAKAADDIADDRSEQEAADLLGHDSVKTTKRHYLRRGKKVGPTK